MGLSPDQVEAMGQGVADTYRAIVDAVVATLSAQVEAALQEGAGWPELLQMADEVRQQAYEQIRDMSKDVRDEVMREVSEALTASLADDLERMGMADELQKVQSATVASAAGTPVRAALGQATAATVSGVMAIVARDNLAMAQDAQSTFLNVSSRYVSLCNAGALSYPDALKRAVSELAERGVGVVEYASGIRNQADVAVLRHLRSQTVQAGNARTMDLCDRYGCRLVEVSSHIGARPSHADWQGQVYRLTDDDPELVAKYEDFWEATGYEGVKGDHARLGDRLCGVNCRHSFAPYIEGTPRMWSPTPDEDAGLDRDEVYKATQRQRAYERQIRQTKREIAALEDAGADASAKRARLRLQQKRLRTLVGENSAYLRRQSWRESVNGYKATGFKKTTEHGISNKRTSGAFDPVDWSVVGTREWSAKFDGLTGNSETDARLASLGKAALTHRQNTDKEDLYLVSAIDGKIKGSQTSSNASGMVAQSSSIDRAVSENPTGTLWGIHNHAQNTAPSGHDFIASAQRSYAGGLAVLPNGDVYAYRHGTQVFTLHYFDQLTRKFRMLGYDEVAAVEKTLDRLADEMGLEWRKL